MRRGHDSNKAAFVATMDAVEEGLGATPGPYFLEDFSLVDITFAPFLERIAASIAYYKGMAVRGQVGTPGVPCGQQRADGGPGARQHGMQRRVGWVHRTSRPVKTSAVHSSIRRSWQAETNPNHHLPAIPQHTPTLMLAGPACPPRI